MDESARAQLRAAIEGINKVNQEYNLPTEGMPTGGDMEELIDSFSKLPEESKSILENALEDLQKSINDVRAEDGRG